MIRALSVLVPVALAAASDVTLECWPVETLERVYAPGRIVPAWRGFSGANRDGRVEIWARHDGSEWLLVFVTAQGLACPVDRGEDWHRIKRGPAS